MGSGEPSGTLQEVHERLNGDVEGAAAGFTDRGRSIEQQRQLRRRSREASLRVEHAHGGAGVEPIEEADQAIHLLGARGQHDDGHVRLSAQSAADIQAIHPRQIQVEHN